MDVRIASQARGMEARSMDALRRVLANIQKSLGQLGVAQKLLIASLVVIMLMALLIVSQYAGKSKWVEALPGASLEEQSKASTLLTDRGIANALQNGRVVVSPADQSTALALLMESRQFAANTETILNNVISKQSWYASKQQNEQIHLLAVQAELGRVISNFRGIKSASVLIDAPERQGLGRAVQLPTASATVFTQSGERLSQSQVDAIAAFIAGAKAGLDVERIRIIDGGAGGVQRKPSSQDDIVPTTYLEHAAKVESHAREKLQDLLAYIPGVIIVTTAQVDVTRVKSETTQTLPKGSGSEVFVKREQTTEDSTTESSPAAEPGVRSNQSADINRGGGSGGSKTSKTTSDAESEVHAGTKSEQVVDPRGMPTMLTVSVNVPRGFVTAELKAAASAGAAAGAAPKDPTEQEITQKFDSDIKKRIRDSIMPIVRAMSSDASKTTDAAALAALLDSRVNVALIPGDIIGGTVMAAQNGISIVGAGGGGSGGGMFGLPGGLVDKAVLGALALIAVGLMISMVRKSGKTPDLPTAEELVGLPPALDAKSDLIGEADETDTPMAGIEVGEEEVHSQKVLEQVQELVEKTPDSAAKMLNRWITVEP